MQRVKLWTDPVIAEPERPSTSDSSQPPVVGHEGAGVPKQFAVPPRQGLHVELRPITPNDYALIQNMELASDLIFRWRFRGTTPSPEQWIQALWGGVLVQYLAVSRATGQPLGLVMAYRANFQDQHAYVAAARFTPRKRSPLMILAFGIFIHYVFTCWPFRKLYLETPEFNYDQFASGLGRYFTREGQLRDHSFFGGQYWDHLILAIDRDTWMERGKPFLELEWPKGMRRVRIRLPQPVDRRPQ